MTLALSLLLTATVAFSDPRPPIVELALEGRLKPALAGAERALEQDAERARALGLDYLRADLLQRLGREREAVEAFARAMAQPILAPWARFRLAGAQLRLGHPEVTAGLAATLVADGAPPRLERAALELVRIGLAGGGDCRLLTGLRRERFDAAERRLLDLIRAECLERAGRASEAAAAAAALLDAETGDALALDAADLLARLAPVPPDPATARRLGVAAYAHREFERAVPWLEVALGEPGAGDLRRWEIRFAVARSEFWLGRFRPAARRFAELAAATAIPRRRAEALYQAARAEELAGEADRALAGFRAAQAAEPLGEWAAASLLSAVRLETLAGEDRAARALVAQLAGRREWRSALARAALFVAAGELARGRSAGVAELLSLAERARATAPEETAYWRGRLSELTAGSEAAVARYLEALARDPFHPFARGALRRLRSPELAAAAAARAAELAAGVQPSELRLAALVAADPALAHAARSRGLAALAELPATAVWLSWAPTPASAWPLWTAPPARPEDLLVGLGRFDEAPGAVLRHFPVARPELGFTGAAQLLATGAAARAIAIAEALFDRRPRVVPIEWVNPRLRQLLYPLPHAGVLRAEAESRRLDPFLLVGVIREESRFDPAAISPAGARGLTQFVLPTARRLGPAIGRPNLEREDLLRPEIAIALGASYLAELSSRFSGREVAMAAAYNAGEDQAALWQRYCFTQEPEELLSKIGFRETRAYVQRVLASRAHYAALYGAAAADGLSGVRPPV